MPFLIFALDHDGKSEVRENLRQAHRDHVSKAGKKLLTAGALLADDKTTVIGGISLLDTDSREEAEKFAYEDPYEKAGIRKQTMILRWRRRWLDGEFLGDN